MKALIRHIATEEDVGKTVENILKKKYSVSSALLTKLKLSGKLTINGKICRSVDIVHIGDNIVADVTEDDKSENIVSTKININILYEDEFILVVNKPRNMSIHPSIGNYDNTLANGIIYYWETVGEQHKFHAVNRIDKDTAGICVIAKNQFAHGVLSNQIKENKFKRRYMAIVHGIMENMKGSIVAPIKRENESVVKRIVAPDGKEAITDYKVVKASKSYSLLDISLRTGRTHQIRVHFSSIGHALVGDWLYGDGDNERDIAKGHLLCANYVEFFHPLTNKKMKFNIKLPDDMKLIN